MSLLACAHADPAGGAWAGATGGVGAARRVQRAAPRDGGRCRTGPAAPRSSCPAKPVALAAPGVGLLPRCRGAGAGVAAAAASGAAAGTVLLPPHTPAACARRAQQAPCPNS